MIDRLYPHQTVYILNTDTKIDAIKAGVIDTGIKDPQREGYWYSVIDDNSCMRTMFYPGVNNNEFLLTKEEYIKYLENIKKEFNNGKKTTK